MSWQHDFSDAIKDTEDARLFFNYAFSDTLYPLFIPKSFAQKILLSGPESVLWKQFLPRKEENNEQGLYDPIGDKVHSKENQIIHRYKNRALFTPTAICPIACRYCFRKNELSNHDKIFDPQFTYALKYLEDHPDINEIIFSGGDPLILSNQKITYYLEAFSKLPQIKYIRFHTRTPIILPNRIEDEFIAVIKKYQKIFKRILIMIHVNHLDEIDKPVEEALLKMTQNEMEVFSQTVLLKGINAETLILKNLFSKLVDLKINPYYLHHPDQVLGAMHFYLTLEEGRKIFAPLRDQLPGWAVPEYVIDIPGGEGKISAFNPESFAFSGVLVNRHGKLISL